MSGPPLLLDGSEGEVIAPAGPGPELLGCDPFAPDASADPFAARLAAAPAPASGSSGSAAAESATSSTASPVRRDASLPRPRVVREIHRRADAPPRATPRAPRLSELEPPETHGWLEALLSESDRLRLSALSHLAPAGAPYDRFGFSPEVIRRAFPVFRALYRAWFRVRSEGHAHIPAEGPALLVSNHAGLLPFDAAMTVMDVLLHTDPPRLPRAVVDRWAGTLPFVNVFFARVGQVIGTRENFTELLEEGQAVLVFPEGIEGSRKRITQRYRVQRFRTGFIEIALRTGAPIVPMAVVGSDDQTPILYDLKPLARLLSLPTAPITPTFPWLGPLGLLPYPVPYRVVYGEPLHFHQRFGPEGAEDARLVRYLANRVRREVQGLLDRSRA